MSIAPGNQENIRDAPRSLLTLIGGEIAWRDPEL